VNEQTKTLMKMLDLRETQLANCTRCMRESAIRLTDALEAMADDKPTMEILEDVVAEVAATLMSVRAG